MNKIIEKDKTLLVDGPALVKILSGKAEVFGFQATNPYRLVIREGKRVPFTAQETTHIWVSLGANATIGEVNENTIPPSWNKAADIALELQKKPAVIMVIGGVDTGKTGFCTYLTNKLVSQKRKVAVLDEDLGQSDIGPPCTIAYSTAAGPITDLFNLREQNAVFIGTTSPSEATNKTIEAATFMINEIIGRMIADFVVVNTDGWVLGEEAIQFKARLATALGVDLLFCLQPKDATTSLCATFGEPLAEVRHEIIDTPYAISERSREKRRNLRELGYAKYLKNAKMRTFQANHITIEDEKALIWNKQAENLLVGIYGVGKKFLGIGIIRRVDYTRKSLKIFTTVTAKPSRIVLGKIRLDINLHEISDQAATSQVNG